MRVNIIVAVAQNGVIGDANKLIWHISEDLRHFKSVTSGHPVIMGRKTHESIGRPLPNRHNIVISRQDITIEGCSVVHSLDEAYALCQEAEDIFVIGGAQIYALALEDASGLYLTTVLSDYQGDTYFPQWDRGEWESVDATHFERGENFEHPFKIELLRRKMK